MNSGSSNFVSDAPLVRKEINLSTPMVTVDGSTIVNKAIDVIRMLVLDCLGVVLALLKHAVHGGVVTTLMVDMDNDKFIFAVVYLNLAFLSQH